MRCFRFSSQKGRCLLSAAIALGFLSGAPTMARPPLCGDNSPAFPVPEFQSGARLWGERLQPARPGVRLPDRRDSTEYDSFGAWPSFLFGYEYFMGLDIVDDRLYMVNLTGFQLWDIGEGHEENPRLVTERIGETGQFLAFGDLGEGNSFLFGVDVMDVANGSGVDDLIALAGEAGTGFCLWRNQDGDLSQVYQDNGAFGRRVHLIEQTRPSGEKRVYTLATGGQGLTVYDVTEAISLGAPCLDDLDLPGNQCPGVKLGTLAGRTRVVGYVDAVQRDGRVFVVVSGGNHSSPAVLQIWEVPDLGNPQTAILRYDGTEWPLPDILGVRGLEIFNWQGVDYLALMHDFRIHIFDLAPCLDDDGCSNLLGTAEWTAELPLRPGEDHVLTYSESLGRPFLHYGIHSDFFRGGRKEGLFDLSSLGTTNQIVEITADGESYADPCSGEPTDYWGYYYGENEYGYRSFAPLQARFAGPYLYRAGRSLFDVHVRPNAQQQPTITVLANNPPHWLGEPVSFTAQPENCSAAGPWTWSASDTMATGLGAGNQNQSITWSLCGDPDSCPDKQVQVSALNTDCNVIELLQIPAGVTLSDPRPRVQGVSFSPSSPSLTFDLGTALSLEAETSGRPPFTYAWEIRDPLGRRVNLANPATNPLVWDTTGLSLATTELIFEDPFETGDTNTWTTPVPPSPSATYTVQLTLSNSVLPASPDLQVIDVTIER